VASYNDITKIFFEAKRLTFPEPHKPVTAKKICVWQRSNKDTSSGDNIHVWWRMPERSHAINRAQQFTKNQERTSLPTYIGSVQWSSFLVIPCSKHNLFDGGTVRQFFLSYSHSAWQALTGKHRYLPEHEISLLFLRTINVLYLNEHKSSQTFPRLHPCIVLLSDKKLLRFEWLNIDLFFILIEVAKLCNSGFRPGSRFLAMILCMRCLQ